MLNSYEFNDETGGTQLAGTFGASLVLTSEEGSPATYEVTLGDFRVTVDPEPDAAGAQTPPRARPTRTADADAPGDPGAHRRPPGPARGTSSCGTTPSTS